MQILIGHFFIDQSIATQSDQPMVVLPNNFVNGQSIYLQFANQVSMPTIQAEIIYISDNVTLGSGNDIYFDINNARSRAYTIYNQVAGFTLKLTYYSPTTNNPLY